MSKISKTARASAGMQVTQKVVVPDAELLKQYREGRAAGLWPSLPSSDAVLRMHDTVVNELNLLQAGLDAMKESLATALADVEHYKRQLVLANSIIETKDKALADIASVAGIAPDSIRIGG